MISNFKSLRQVEYSTKAILFSFSRYAVEANKMFFSNILKIPEL